MNEYKDYLVNKVPELLQKLKFDAEPGFGIMTAQHMIGHLIWVTKSLVKDYCPFPDQFNR